MTLSTTSTSKAVDKIICKPQNYLGEALREMRIQKELTQIQASDLSGVDQTRWSAYETGKHMPSLETIIQIAMALKFNPLELITKSLIKSPYFESIQEIPFANNEIITEFTKMEVLQEME